MIRRPPRSTLFPNTPLFRSIRQTGGRGQYGHVGLGLEPLPAGGGFEFVDGTKGGVIPREYIPAIEKGVKEAMESGMLAGYPVVDVKATVVYGSYHEVDSSEIAFKIAGSMAFKEAMGQASPVILEPIMSLEVVTPEEFMGNHLERHDGLEEIGRAHV